MAAVHQIQLPKCLVGPTRFPRDVALCTGVLPVLSLFFDSNTTNLLRGFCIRTCRYALSTISDLEVTDKQWSKLLAL